MGLLTDTVLETLTDRLVSRIETAVVAPADGMLLANANTGLASYLDGASEDPAVQAALLMPCSAIDKQVLGPEYGDYIRRVIDDSGWKALCTAVEAYVKSANGGGYADLRTYLAAVDAELHPLAGEVFRAATNNTGLFSDGTDVVGVMHPRMQAVPFDRVYTGAQGALVDDTVDAADVGTADVALFTSNNHILALGSRHKFDRILFDLSTSASMDVGFLLYYWNGAAWTSLGHDTLTAGFTIDAGMISFTTPSDWEPHAEDMQGTPAPFDTTQEGELYYVILQRTEATVVTPPVATWLQCVPTAILATDGGLYGVDQPPIAMVRITAANTCAVTVIQQPDLTRFEPPGIANNALKLVAVNSFTSNITFTLGYTDQDGNAATKAQSVWSGAIAAGATANLALDTLDTGITTIVPGTCAITTDNTAGIFLVVQNDYARSIATK